MTGTVSRRAAGDWEYRFDLGPDPLTGKRRRRTKSGFATKREASKALRDALRAHEQGRSVRNSRKSLTEFLREWHTSVEPSLRPSTWVNYPDYFEAYVVPHIGDTALQDLTPVRLNLLYAHLLKSGRVRGAGGLSAKTVQNVHRMMHRALRDAVKWDLVPRNVAEDALAPKSRRPKVTIWTPEQLGAFVAHVRGDRFFALWLLVVTTGLRRGELAGLRWSDVDLVHETLSPTTPRVVVAGHAHESEPKTTSGERRLALDPDTADALRDYLNLWAQERDALGQSTQLLFVWPSGSTSIPTPSPHSSTDTATPRASPGSGCTTYGTHTRPRHSWRALHRGSSVNASGTRAWRSRSRSTRRSSRAWTDRWPSRLPPSSWAPSRARTAMVAFWVAWRPRPSANKTGLGRSPRPAVVAGAGFEPATSGIAQGDSECYLPLRETAESLVLTR